ncbi:tRNA sulfurtransferase [bacterium HR19]|nr:tRNA sulfurtransferase [bacterium HR19]
MNFRYLITVSGELPIKSSKTRIKFYRTLLSNIKHLLKEKGSKTYKLEIISAKIFLETDTDVLEDLARVFGVMRVAKVEVMEFSDIKDLVLKIGERTKDMVSGKKFAVRVSRSGEHNFSSEQFARELGAFLKPYSAGVDLENPDVEIRIEIRDRRAFLYKNLLSACGGLPIGTEGRALSLFSGGFDSPVASYLIAKRGVKIDFLHFFFGSVSATRLAFSVAKKLTEKWFYGHNPKFYFIDLTELIDFLAGKVRWEFRQVVLRTLMYRIASKVAGKKYSAVITGESIGQASSQTLANIRSCELVSGIEIPILRPLLGFDKTEIIDYSRKIGTYELSSKVCEACAIAPKKVRTKTEVEELKSEFEKLPEDLIDKAIAEMKTLDVRSSIIDDILVQKSVIIDYIPDDAVVLDLRDYSSYIKWHYPGALHYDNVNLEELKDKTLVLYCYAGAKSYLEALRLRAKNIKAYSFAGGLENIKKIAKS